MLFPGLAARMLTRNNQAPIGVFDSGVGGLSVLRALWEELPGTPIIYLADQAHVPYGKRSLEEVQTYSLGICEFLKSKGAYIIVVACNAASAAALRTLREIYPATPFVGMEPAVKPAAQITTSGVVGVLATPATFQGALYASVIERYANNIEVIQDTCPGLVELIEAGELDSTRVTGILEKALQPMLDRNVDTIVLGCTHYPFVIPRIEAIVGDAVRVIDPAPAVARQAVRIFKENLKSDPNVYANDPLQESGMNSTTFFTTGDPHKLEKLMQILLGVNTEVRSAVWEDKKLV